MCHSVESYIPRLALSDAEHRLGAADFAAARHERAAVDAAAGLLRRVLRALGSLGGRGATLTPPEDAR